MARGGVNAAAIVEAAAELADTEGPQAVSLTRLAGILGVRPPSLYAHIGGLDDVLRRLGARGASELAAALSRAVEGRSGQEALRALAVAYREFAHRHPGTYAAAQRSRDLAGDSEARAAGEAVVRVALAVLREYGLEGDDAIHAVRLIRISLHGFISLENAGGFALDLSLDETFDRLLAMLDLALRQAQTS
ncbi:MAG: WHG domain-containing protein [Actinomycetota bacterium]|nr:WHG domain-containing protein [Actinomycetota bacterium]